MLDCARKHGSAAERPLARRTLSQVDDDDYETIPIRRPVDRSRQTFSAAMVATMVLAVGTGTAVYDVFSAVLLRPLPYPNAGRLVDMWNTFPGLDIPQARQSVGTYLSYRQSSRMIEDLAMCDAIPATLVYSDPTERPERIRAAITTASRFSLLGARPIAGRLFTSADEQAGAPAVAIIDERLWRARFGATPSIVGTKVLVDGVQREIIGVVPATLAYPKAETRLWEPFVIDPKIEGGYFPTTSGPPGSERKLY